jgi:PAS domain S-box-containing protein
MANRDTGPERKADLRVRAASRLGDGPQGAPYSASTALAVLQELALSPSTAADALAVLHELQVQQVELDLQAEELRNTQAQLEVALQRQIQLYDAAPVGCFTVDAQGTLQELNLSGAAMLGVARDELPGQSLFSFLAPGSVPALKAALARAGAGAPRASCTLQLMAPLGTLRTVLAAVNADPGRGQMLLVALMEDNAGGPPAR